MHSSCRYSSSLASVVFLSQGWVWDLSLPPELVDRTCRTLKGNVKFRKYTKKVNLLCDHNGGIKYNLKLFNIAIWLVNASSKTLHASPHNTEMHGHTNAIKIH